MTPTKKKRDGKLIEQSVNRAVDFEVSIADLAKRSERRAWAVALCSVAMSLALLGGYFYMLPMKEKVPYLVMADPFSGNATMARLVGNFSEEGISANEALNRSNIHHFVVSRESYDSALIGQGDWRTVYTMSAPDVAAGYTQLHSRNNPDSPSIKLGSRIAIRVKILSIVFQAGGTDVKTATVRFQRSLYDKSSGSNRFLDNKIATLSFKYDKNLRMSEADRVANPLGFRVVGYRVDSDFADTPPVLSDVNLDAAVGGLRAAVAGPSAGSPGFESGENQAQTPESAASARTHVQSASENNPGPSSP